MTVYVIHEDGSAMQLEVPADHIRHGFLQIPRPKDPKRAGTPFAQYEAVCYTRLTAVDSKGNERVIFLP